MKEKIAVVTDSTAYLPAETVEKYNIHVIPLSVIIDGEVYKEGIDITTAEFYEKAKAADQFPTSSQPSPGEFVQLFEEMKEQGYTHVFSIHLSSGISGTYQNALSSGQIVEGIEVIGIDSGLSCMAQGSLAVKASELIAQGSDSQEILEALEKMLTTMDAYFLVDDLNNLQRGGRLSGAQALIGSLLQIKPILYFEDKVITLFEKVRTKKKALKRIEELLGQAVKRGEAKQAYVIHGNDPESGQKWLEVLQASYPTVEFHLSYFGPVIGTHLGEGALGLTWASK